MKVVVDASNVAYSTKNENSQPQMSNILAAVKSLEESGDEFVIIADASLRHDIDDKEKFEKLLESENVEEVPAGNDADHFILNIAHNEKAKILENVTPTADQLTVTQDGTDKARANAAIPSHWVRGMHVIATTLNVY